MPKTTKEKRDETIACLKIILKNHRIGDLTNSSLIQLMPPHLRRHHTTIKEYLLDMGISLKTQHDKEITDDIKKTLKSIHPANLDLATLRKGLSFKLNDGTVKQYLIAMNKWPLPHRYNAIRDIIRMAIRNDAQVSTLSICRGLKRDKIRHSRPVVARLRIAVEAEDG